MIYLVNASEQDSNSYSRARIEITGPSVVDYHIEQHTLTSRRKRPVLKSYEGN